MSQAAEEGQRTHRSRGVSSSSAAGRVTLKDSQHLHLTGMTLPLSKFPERGPHEVHRF